MTFDINNPMRDPAFRSAYRKEALTLSQIIPALCQNSATALMALMATAASVVISAADGIPPAEARKIMIDAVNLIFDAMEDRERRNDLAAMEPKGES